MSAFKLTEERRGTVVVLRAEGRMTLENEPDGLRGAIRALLDQGQPRIVLDLSKVSYVDSAGIGTMVSAFSSVRSAGGTLVLASLPKRLADLLQITKLSTVFDTYDSVDQAVAQLEAAPAR